MIFTPISNSLVSRKGETRSFHVARINKESMIPLLRNQIERSSTLYTDTASHYKLKSDPYR